MKQLTRVVAFRSFLTLLCIALMQAAVFAQDQQPSGSGSTTTTVTTHQSTYWYSSPWVWVLGAAIFILLLVALLRGGSKDTSTSDRVTVQKTVTRDAP
jgi:hypothetical protein